MELDREINLPTEAGEPPLPEEILREQQATPAPPQPQDGGADGSEKQAGAQKPEPPQPPPAEAQPEQTDAAPKFFEVSVAPVAQHKFASAIPPERIPPPPPLDHDRYLTDPAYAKAYMEAVTLYQAAVAEATRKQIEARLARYEMASLGPAVNQAFVQGMLPFLDGFQTQEEKEELARAVLQARDAAVSSGKLERMADPSFWAAVAAAAAARTGVLFRQGRAAAAGQQAQRTAGQPARSFSTQGSPGNAGAPNGGQRQYQLTDEERRLAAEFGLTEEEWIRNMTEGT